MEMVDTVTPWVNAHEQELTLLLSTFALLVSALALIQPSIRAWRDQKSAIFKAIQEDRKAIAIVTLSVLSGEWDSRLRTRPYFRFQLLDSLAIAMGLESSDRGKAYVLAALEHVSNIEGDFRLEAIERLEAVREIFEAYANTGADPKFRNERIGPLDAILGSLRHDE